MIIHFYKVIFSVFVEKQLIYNINNNITTFNLFDLLNFFRVDKNETI